MRAATSSPSANTAVARSISAFTAGSSGGRPQHVHARAQDLHRLVEVEVERRVDDAIRPQREQRVGVAGRADAGQRVEPAQLGEIAALLVGAADVRADQREVVAREHRAHRLARDVAEGPLDDPERCVSGAHRKQATAVQARRKPIVSAWLGLPDRPPERPSASGRRVGRRDVIGARRYDRAPRSPNPPGGNECPTRSNSRSHCARSSKRRRTRRTASSR
jgi:hypothetical protein